MKQKLAEFVLAKKQREAAQNGVTLRHLWAQRPQMSLDQCSPPPAATAMTTNGKSAVGNPSGKSDFPLRKTGEKDHFNNE